MRPLRVRPVIGSLATALASLASAYPAGATEIIVNPGESIQAAIIAAINGDVITVMAGTYTEAIDFHAKAITVRSAAGPDATFIEAPEGYSAVQFVDGEGPATVLRGFTLTGIAPGFGRGGCMTIFSASPTIEDCHLANGISVDGGGARIRSGSLPRFIGCRFSGNWSTSGLGGAVTVESTSASFESCVFHNNGNFSADGGVMRVTGPASVTFTDCTFTNNRADEGSIFNGPAATATFTRCRIEENQSGESYGAIYAAGLVLDRCTVVNNRTNGDQSAGHILVLGPATVVNSLIAGNADPRTGGITANTLTMIQSVLADNESDTGPVLQTGMLSMVGCAVLNNRRIINAGAIIGHVHPLSTIRSSVIWGNAGPATSALFGDSVVISHSVVQGGYPGPGNLDADPRIVPSDNGGVRVMPSSPCIDAGDTAALPADTYDVDGDGDTAEPLPLDIRGLARRLDAPTVPDTGVGPAPVADIGPWETCPADWNQDGGVNSTDISAFLTDWIGGVQEADAGVDVNGDGVVNSGDISALLAIWLATVEQGC